jgi:3-deoxy-D-manno-octulosonate 8-phosphate phosphatase (KDO 8-P phosphatase)
VRYHGNQDEIRKQAAGVRLLILDVDGVLTDGGLVFYGDGSEAKVFHVRDGYGIRLVQRAGIEVAILSGRSSEVVTHRAGELGIRLVVQGSKDKRADYEQMLEQRHLADTEVAYVGDDLMDIPVLRRVGLAVAVSDAVEPVHSCAHVTTMNRGGHGAVREVCDLLLQARAGREEVVAPHPGETTG